jgi:hemerythrin superfamily protein
MAEDAITLITRDHREMEDLFAKLRNRRDSRPELLRQVAAMLIAHSRAEEERVYPEIVKADPGERDEVHHGTEEHREAEELLRRLEKIDPSTAEFDSLLTEFVDAVKHHIEEEESEILPALGEAVGKAKLVEMGRAFAEHRQRELDKQQPAGGGGSADDMTKDELYGEARRAGVEGRSQMSKEELARAVNRER